MRPPLLAATMLLTAVTLSAPLISGPSPRSPRLTAPPSQDFESLNHLADFFADLISKAPISDPEPVISTMGAIDQIPNPSVASSRLDLAAKSRALYDRLANRLPVLRITLKSGVPSWIVEPTSIEVSRGLTHYVIVELTNGSPGTIRVGASFDGCNDGSLKLHAISEGHMAPQLVSLRIENPNTTTATLALSGDLPAARLLIPIHVTEPAVIDATVLDSRSRTLTPARIHLSCSDGLRRYGSPFAAEKTFTEKNTLVARPPGFYKVPFFYSNGHFRALVPAGRTDLLVERGFEHLPVRLSLLLQPGETRKLEMKSDRLIDMPRLGWISGDTHVHWVKNHWSENERMGLLSLAQRAEDLHVVNNLTLLHRNPGMQEFLAPTQFPTGPIRSVSTIDYHIQMAQEYRNEGLYGHMIFLNINQLIAPISTGQGIMGPGALDWPLNRPAILKARRQGGISIEAHQLPFEQPANLIDGLTDSIDQLDPQTYYQVLNAGLRAPLTNGSDHPARTIGYARAYVKVRDARGYQAWIDGIRRGQTFVSSGPLLFLSVNGKEIGEQVSARRKDAILVVARVVSRYPVGKFEVVSNGKVIASRQISGTSGEIRLTLPADESRWIVCRATNGSQWNSILDRGVAHTSASYVEVDGKPIFKTEAALGWAAHLRRHAEHIRTAGQFSSNEQREGAMAISLRAAEKFERWAKQGHPDTISK